MKRLSALVTLALALATSGVAHAQSSLDLDGDEDRGSAKKQAKAPRTLEGVVVREIERGIYLKTNIGTTVYLGSRAQLLRAGTTLNFTVGMDVIDKPKASLAWEVTLYQSIHNSSFATYDQAPQIVGNDPSRLLQGDVHVFGALAGIEGSGYPVRRLGIGGRVGGGVAFAPLLINRDYYAEVLSSWGTPAPDVHESALPAIYAGPTFEYYTKLSHFSLGLDVEFLYIIGLDFGLTASAYLKYTF